MSSAGKCDIGPGVALYCNGCLYIESKREKKMFILDTRFNGWSLRLTPTMHFGLAAYHSKPVLIGGQYLPYESGVRDLWDILPEQQISWPISLPPMPRGHISPHALGTPNCLVVSSGKDSLDVDVLVDNQWSTVVIKRPEREYLRYSETNLAYYRGRIYIQLYFHPVYYCEEEALLACVRAMRNHAITQPSVQWNSLKSPQQLQFSYFVSFQQNLIATDHKGNLYFYHPSTLSWVLFGSLPDGYDLILSDGSELITMARWNSVVYKASLAGTDAHNNNY